MLDFEWDEAKRRANLSKHGVDFADAAAVFDDPFGIDDEERSMDYGETRRKLIGYVSGQLLSVTYASRGERLRLISARKASRNRGEFMKNRTNLSGQTDWARLEAMTDDEAEANALSDPDNPPTPESAAPVGRMARAQVIRRALRLTQEEFAARYQIPLGTLRDWEQHRSEPDQPARTYLKLIATDPEAVARLLQGKSAA